MSQQSGIHTCGGEQKLTLFEDKGKCPTGSFDTLWLWQCSVFTTVVSTILFTTVVFTMLFTTGAIFDEIFLWQVFWAAPHKVQIVPGLSQRTILALQNIPKYPSWTPYWVCTILILQRTFSSAVSFNFDSI